MIPESITYFHNATEGEKRVFEILKDVLIPDEEYIAWYEPNLINRFGSTLHPDFIIWGQNIGLSILEIKDWSIDYFEGSTITSNEIILINGDRLKNPERQALDYMYNTMSNLQKMSCLINPSGTNSGKLKFPCGYGVVLHNITRCEYEDKLKTVINTERILTADEILKIETGDRIILKAFLKRIRNVNISFQPLNPEELKTMRSVLSPKVIIPNTDVENDREESIKILDREQEKEAYKIGPGHRVIKGVAGSGKTVLIAYRAKILKMINPNWKILIICYNITLKNYIRDYLLKSITLGQEVNTDDIEIYYFHEFIKIKYNVYTEDRPKDWVILQNQISEKLNQRLNAGQIEGEIYNAILIDECQDLVTDYIKFLVHLLKKNTDHLLIALDPDQNIYNFGNKISWKSLGIEATGRRTKELKKSYRNTAEILEFAKKFNPNKNDDDQNDINTPLFPDFHERHGNSPIIKPFETDLSIVDYIINEINNLVTDRKLKYSEIGILFTKKNTLRNNQTKRNGPFSYYNLLLNKLNELNIPFKKIETVTDKSKFDFQSNEIKIISIHSVKGYEFKTVFFINLENDWIYDDLTRTLIYVGITRAQDLLYIPYLIKGKHLKYINEMISILE